MSFDVIHTVQTAYAFDKTFILMDCKGKLLAFAIARRRMAGTRGIRYRDCARKKVQSDIGTMYVWLMTDVPGVGRRERLTMPFIV